MTTNYMKIYHPIHFLVKDIGKSKFFGVKFS